MRFNPGSGKVARGYWTYLLVIWAAIRFGRHGVMLVICLPHHALLGAQITRFFRRHFQKTGLLNLWFYIWYILVGTILALTLYTISWYQGWLKA